MQIFSSELTYQSLNWELSLSKCSSVYVNIPTLEINIAHPEKIIQKCILMVPNYQNQMNFLYFHIIHWFNVQAFLKYLTLIQSGTWENSIFVITFLLIFKILTIFIPLEVSTCCLNCDRVLNVSERCCWVFGLQW